MNGWTVALCVICFVSGMLFGIVETAKMVESEIEAGYVENDNIIYSVTKVELYES